MGAAAVAAIVILTVCYVWIVRPVLQSPRRCSGERIIELVMRGENTPVSIRAESIGIPSNPASSGPVVTWKETIAVRAGDGVVARFVGTYSEYGPSGWDRYTSDGARLPVTQIKWPDNMNGTIEFYGKAGLEVVVSVCQR